MAYEYKCVGAPERPRRSRRARSPNDRAARAMEKIIRDEAVDGWEYMRTDHVVVIEKASFLSRPKEVHRAVMIFRRDTESLREKAAERTRRQKAPTELFSEKATITRPFRRLTGASETAPEPVVAHEPAPEPAPEPEPVAAPEPAPEVVEERPRRRRAIPAEEPIRLSADDMVGAPRAGAGRDRLPPSGLG